MRQHQHQKQRQQLSRKQQGQDVDPDPREIMVKVEDGPVYVPGVRMGMQGQLYLRCHQPTYLEADHRRRHPYNDALWSKNTHPSSLFSVVKSCE